ncbi:MAG: ankyrin repeat domain-containing protein [Vicinamibacterales bacterium]|nr:ankyrin repeat domain-containing protein [Vicinamibacterales bacterium]
MKKLLVFLLACSPASLAAQTAQPQLPPAASVKVDYDQHVRPLLSQNCYSCHGAEVQQSGLRLDLRQNALRGGDYGPVINPGNSAESKLIRRLVNGDGGLQMPPTGALTDEEIGVLRAWIDQGAEFRTEIADEPAPKPVDPTIVSFISAIRSGDTKSVESLISANPDIVKAKDLTGTTPLHHAAGFGTLEMMQVLLDKGADVNVRNRRSSTPLHWAIHDAAKVRVLVARGAAVNVKSIEGRTPVYQAAVLANGCDALRILLDKGADPKLATLVGQTPLMASSVRGDLDSMRLLLEKGADVNAKNSAGETALMFAATNGAPAAVRLLLEKGADATVKSKRTETALGNAATAGVEETVQLLLDREADVNTRNIRGYSPLMLAAGSDSVPTGTVKLLLAKGADASYSADYDETARMLASKRGDTEVTRLLGGLAPESARPAALTLARDARAGSITEAVERATALMAKQSYTFIRTGGCNSCHSQDLPSAASGYARDRGILRASEIPQLPASMLPSPERIMDLNVVSVNSISWELFDFGLNHQPKNMFTDAVVRYVKAMQLPEGNWSSNEGRRPPMNAGDFQTAALAIFAMKHYGPDAEKATTDAAIAKAVKWLESAGPTSTQDRAFHLLGLAWANGAPGVIKNSARSLAALQRTDGGWSQMPTMVTDAYATGQVLFALNAAGKMPVTAPVYRKGVDYLMRSQAADGSWHVETRSIWLQPYFESGFPYARDQFISVAGTAWASMALATAADTNSQPKKMTRR